MRPASRWLRSYGRLQSNHAHSVTYRTSWHILHLRMDSGVDFQESEQPLGCRASKADTTCRIQLAFTEWWAPHGGEY